MDSMDWKGMVGTGRYGMERGRTGRSCGFRQADVFSGPRIGRSFFPLAVSEPPKKLTFFFSPGGTKLYHLSTTKQAAARLGRGVALRDVTP